MSVLAGGKAHSAAEMACATSYQLLGTTSYLPNSLLVAVGGMLVVYGVLLFFLAMQQKIWFSWITIAIILDFVGVAGSGLTALGGEFLPLAGRKLIIGVAIIVAVLALMQYIGLRRYAINCEAKEFSMSTLSAIGASWLSMKLWVKIWLFFLNFVFIAALAFLSDDPAVIWILISYVGSGSYLLAFMVPQRGLSRLLGLAHIVPWTPDGLFGLPPSGCWTAGAIDHSCGTTAAPYLHTDFGTHDGGGLN
jgi:hypothetical protein